MARKPGAKMAGRRSREPVATPAGNGNLTSRLESGATLHQVTSQMLDYVENRKLNKTQSREGMVHSYLIYLRNCAEIPDETMADHVSATLLDLASRSESDGEMSMCLQAFAANVLLCPAVSFIDAAFTKLRRMCGEQQSSRVKCASILALAVAVASPDAAVENMSRALGYFAAIVGSDGAYVHAEDSAAVVETAMMSWVFVAAHMEDFSPAIDVAMAAFMDQLQSSDVSVVTMASYCIAFVFEESRFREMATGKSYEIGVRPDDAADEMNSVSNFGVVKKTRRAEFRQALASAVTSIERGVGPHFSLGQSQKSSKTKNAKGGRFISGMSDGDEDGHAASSLGCAKKITMGNEVLMINTWGLDFKIEMLKRFLASGYIDHIMHNDMVRGRLDRVDGLEEHQYPEGY